MTLILSILLKYSFLHYQIPPDWPKMMHSATSSAFVVDVAPPPSYDQAIDSSSSFSNPTMPIQIRPNGIELSEKVVAQSEVIREQEAEIGKLKRDLGRIREQLERMAKGGNGGGDVVADKLAQRLAAAVGEEAEEQRQKNRSRKGDILRGTLCCIALLAVLLLGLYIVLSRPNSKSSTTAKTMANPTPSKPKLENFKVIGKAVGDSLCWAQGLVLPSGQILGCHIFRRSIDDRRLFCEFSLKNDKQGNEQPIIVRGNWRTRRKGLIVIRDARRKRREEIQRNGDDVEHILLHTLNGEEAMEARKKCTEIPLPRLMRPTPLGMGQGMGRTWMGPRRWQRQG